MWSALFAFSLYAPRRIVAIHGKLTALVAVLLNQELLGVSC